VAIGQASPFEPSDNRAEGPQIGDRRVRVLTEMRWADQSPSNLKDTFTLAR